MNQPHDAPPREQPPPAALRERLVMPDIGLGVGTLTISLWLVAVGDRVAAGDRVVEIVAGSATIDLEAPLPGRLVAILRDEDDPVAAGDVLAEFEAAP